MEEGVCVCFGDGNCFCLPFFESHMFLMLFYINIETDILLLWIKMFQDIIEGKTGSDIHESKQWEGSLQAWNIKLMLF